MGRSAGPGSPLTFRCATCRSLPDFIVREAGWKYGRNVVRTGRERERRPNKGSALGVRSLREQHEYRCKDCGHVGWSRHTDILRFKVEHG
jgi:predicted RNA-binding Zn-ribbon protein involved in translation (DUF1610 family)